MVADMSIQAQSPVRGSHCALSHPLPGFCKRVRACPSCESEIQKVFLVFRDSTAKRQDSSKPAKWPASARRQESWLRTRSLLSSQLKCMAVETLLRDGSLGPRPAPGSDRRQESFSISTKGMLLRPSPNSPSKRNFVYVNWQVVSWEVGFG